MAEKMTVPQDLAPVPVTVIGTGSVVQGPDPIVSGTEATTPNPNQPNLLVTVISPLMAIAIRFGHAFLTSMVGLLVAGMTPAGGALLYTGDFAHLLVTCANLSLPIAGLGLIKDCVTIFGRLETRFPLSTGSV